MVKQKYVMNVERSQKMDLQKMQKLSDMRLAPYMQLATGLIGKARHAGGNMFRHQMDTLAILIDYGYIDSVLLKASIVHDTVEDIPDFDKNQIINADDEGQQVLASAVVVTVLFVILEVFGGLWKRITVIFLFMMIKRHRLQTSAKK